MFFPEPISGSTKKLNTAPLMCWDLCSSYIQKLYERGNDKEYLRQFLSNKECLLPYDMDTCLSVYDAVVITDPQQVIHWVSSGFTHMTGYTPREAVNRRPDFLQGLKSNHFIKKRVRQNLQSNQGVKAQLINYTKSGQEYLCDITIEPVYSKRKQLLSFIAFEKEIKKSI